MSKHRKTSRRRWLATLLLVAFAGVGGVLFFFGARVGLAAYQLYDSASSLHMLTTSPAAMEPALLASELRRADQALDVLQADGGPLLRSLAGMPATAPAAQAALDLLAVGEQGVTLARTLLATVQPHWTSLQAKGSALTPSLYAALALAADAGDDVVSLAPDFENLANTATRAATHDSLPDPIHDTLVQLAQGSRFGAAVASLGPHLGWLLGMESPRTLLMLAQNNDELRATGGFIAAAGTITLDKGRLTINDLVDSYAIYREDVDHPPAPPALQKYMQAYILLLRDANWSPDAPTSAQVAADLYELDTGVPVDGVLLLDTGALAHLVRALGAVTLPNRGVTLTAAELEQQLIDFWNPEIVADDSAAVNEADAISATAPANVVLPSGWWDQRKDFVPQVAQAVLLQAQAGGGDSLALASAVLAALGDRSLQLWVEDKATASALYKLGWDGALAPQPGADFLAVVDSNVGFNKVDAVIERSVDYAVDWPLASNSPEPAAPTATLTLTYTHPLSVTDPGCDQTPRYGNSYADMTERCYFDYMRVYAPAGSRLLSSSGLQPGSTTSEGGEKGLHVFAGYFVQPPGTVHTVTLTYALPAALQLHDYALVLQRQAGTRSLPVSLRAGPAATTVELQSGRLDWRPEPES